MATPTPFIITGVLQQYAWGGQSFIADFLQLPATKAPNAEYWMGMHPKGSAHRQPEGTPLLDIVQQQPAAMLGDAIARRYDQRLPFLFKILDVKAMLSIQVHPDKGAAEAGFAREEALGIPRNAPDRNFRDDNHKPELGVALSDFYLLHGFLPEPLIARSLQEIPGWESLTPILTNEGVSGLYQYVMEADQPTINQLLQPLVQTLAHQQITDKQQPAFWARRAIEQYSQNGQHDRGIFSIYWFNIVHLRAGEAIFQDAGIPHAYLEGQCLELMANSDNVLRGGLTPKHIDVAELLLNTSTRAVSPRVLSPEDDRAAGWKYYPTPAPDFALHFCPLAAGDTRTWTATGPEILLLFSGRGQLGSLELSPAVRTAFLPAGSQANFAATEDTLIYRATVGKTEPNKTPPEG